MPGLIAIFGEQDETAELDPLIEKVWFRGASLEVETVRDSQGLVLLGSAARGNENDMPAAIDGYMVFSKEEGTVLQGSEGEARFCDLLEKEGLSCFENIEGEFAVAYFGNDGGCLIARDPFGVKPLYYAEKEGALYIAPEIKALVGLKSPIKEAPPGSYYENGRGWIRYYRLPENLPEAGLSLEKAEAEMRRLLYLAVKERLSGAENPGVYLSGGLDSSVVAAIAAEISPAPVRTYTVGVKGSRDIEFARIVADRIGSEPHVYTYDLEEMLSVLPAVIYHLESFDCAYVRSAIPNYIAARQAAADGRKVMLTGEGSDEIFAGYSYLKKLGSEEKIALEMDGFMKTLSRTGLQRVDRMNAAHGLECRVPFLKPALPELVGHFPLDWKLHDLDGEPVDKWILRKAFAGALGRKVAWREKEQFDQGSGSAEMMAGVAEEAISDADFEEESAAAPVPVRNKEELYYYRLFRRFYPEEVLPLVGRWTRTG